MIKKRVIVLIGALVLGALPHKSHALELGMKPSQVFGLWVNIHTLHEELMRAQFVREDLMEVYLAIGVKKFTDIKPENVYARGLIVHEKLSRHFDLPEAALIPAWVQEFKKIDAARQDGPIRPSQVYLLSSAILNQLAAKFIEVTLAQKPIGAFYQTHDFEDISPSDVYGLVHQLEERLDLISSATARP